MEEIKESEDSTDNKIIPNSNLPSEGSPSGLARDIKPGLNSSTKTTKILQKKKSQKICSCAVSDLHEKYVYLFRSHWLVAKTIL